MQVKQGCPADDKAARTCECSYLLLNFVSDVVAPRGPRLACAIVHAVGRSHICPFARGAMVRRAMRAWSQTRQASRPSLSAACVWSGAAGAVHPPGKRAQQIERVPATAEHAPCGCDDSRADAAAAGALQRRCGRCAWASLTQAYPTVGTAACGWGVGLVYARARVCTAHVSSERAWRFARVSRG
jgi:hypothetical protein